MAKDTAAATAGPAPLVLNEAGKALVAAGWQPAFEFGAHTGYTPPPQKNGGLHYLNDRMQLVYVATHKIYTEAEALVVLAALETTGSIRAKQAMFRTQAEARHKGRGLTETR